MKDFLQLNKNLKKDYSSLRSLRVALLGDTSTQFLNQAIRGLGYEYKYDINILEAKFNQIELQILDETSDLYSFKPEIVIVFHSTHKLLEEYNICNPDQRNHLANIRLELINTLYQAICKNLDAKVIYLNYPEIDDGVYGSYSNSVISSFIFQLRKLNYELMLFSANNHNFFLCDISSIQNYFGRKTTFQSSIYINSETVFSFDVLPDVAAKILAIIGALQGKVNKCLILDLDNTLWGGIIGDDGIESIQLGNLGIGKAFTEFQRWIKKLKNRGIILVICSKNTDAVAREVFLKHPDMIIDLDDITMFVANWDSKVDNIKMIQRELNINFDSMIFIDDNIFERAIVRECLPEIIVPELPEDPAEYLEYLYNQHLFDTTSVSDEDAIRTQLYRAEFQRSAVQKETVDSSDFMKNLQMISSVQPLNSFNIPRAAQLSQRSNQFNLRTIRYTEADLWNISCSEKYYSFVFSLEDKFGDNGIISVVILKIEAVDTLFIESWFMSCRVLKRGVESFVLNTIARFAKEKRISKLKGEFIPTAKNELVKDHYRNLGFIPQTNFWILTINETSEPLQTYITSKV